MKFNEKDILLGDIYATSIIIDTFPLMLGEVG